MVSYTSNLIVGQGIAGTTLAWQLLEAGEDFVILDADEEFTASKVAAGLVTPWTGRRMTQSDFDDSWQEAVSFYRSVEERLSVSLFEESSAIRLFVSRSDASHYDDCRATDGITSTEPWSGTIQAGGRPFDGCRMQPAGRLKVKQYLQASADFFREQQRWYRYRLDLSNGLTIEDDRVVVPELKLSADRVIFCQGATANPLFAQIPGNPAKGEILNVTVVGYQCREAVHHSIWLAPEDDGTITAGATYDWKNVDTQPTAQGRREILNAMRRFVDGDILLNEHSAAVRPTMKDYQPVIGQHPEQPNLHVFNGLGSRGVLRGPRLARMLVDCFANEGGVIPREYSLKRLQSGKNRKPLTGLAQEKIREHVRSGDTVVDATVGNGFDTCFLAGLVGSGGRVYGFDIQQRAIDSTRQRLSAADFTNVELIADGHQRLSDYVDRPISGAMLNLGYLPKSDHLVITQPASTIAALDQLRERLRSGGVITILAYRGHVGGPEEAESVECWLRTQQPGCRVERIESGSGGDTSPVLFVLVNES